MAPIGQFIQLLSALGEMQSRRDQMRISQQEQDLREKQFGELVKSGHTKDVADALQQIMRLAPQAREAFIKLQNSGEFSPTELAMFQGVSAGQPVDPAVLGAQAAQTGYQSASPDQQAFLNSQAASRATTGMDLGAAQASGAQAFGLGGQAPPGLVAAMGGSPFAQQMQHQLALGALQFQANRQTPIQAAIEGSAMNQGLIPGFAQSQYGTTPSQYGRLTPQVAGQLDVGRGGVQAQFAGVNQRAVEAAQAYGIELMKLNASGKAGMGGIMPSQLSSMMEAIPKVLDDMQNPRATKEANLQRIRWINSMAALMPPGIAEAITIHDPENMAQPVSLWRQLVNRTFSGANQPPMVSQYPQSQMPSTAPPAFMPSLPAAPPMPSPFQQLAPPAGMYQQPSPLAPFIR